MWYDCDTTSLPLCLSQLAPRDSSQLVVPPTYKQTRAERVVEQSTRRQQGEKHLNAQCPISHAVVRFFCLCLHQLLKFPWFLAMNCWLSRFFNPCMLYHTCWVCAGSEQAGNSRSKTWKAKSFVRRFWKQGDPEKRTVEVSVNRKSMWTVLNCKGKKNINAVLNDWFWSVLPERHLCEIMAMSGSIHLTKVESLFITLSDSTRLRNTKKSASWDSTTLLLSPPETMRQQKDGAQTHKGYFTHTYVLTEKNYSMDVQHSLICHTN